MSPKFKGIAWLGVKTEQFDALCDFYENKIGLTPKYTEKEGFRVFDLPNGDRIEIFGREMVSHDHFTTGPVAGFSVDDVLETRADMEKEGIEFIGPTQTGSASRWAHFRGPDGNIYEITDRKV